MRFADGMRTRVSHASEVFSIPLGLAGRKAELALADGSPAS